MPIPSGFFSIFKVKYIKRKYLEVVCKNMMYFIDKESIHRILQKASANMNLKHLYLLDHYVCLSLCH
jgi:chemotaxis methyl-accepting protein methylase